MKPSEGVSRRGLLGVAGAGVVGLGAGVAATVALGHDRTGGAVGPGSSSGVIADSYPFYGSKQAGILTPAQDRLHFAAFDLTSGATRADLIALLQQWTQAAARMTQGLGSGPIGPTSGNYAAPPDDTGEAIGLASSGLTITFGFGPSLFRDASGRDRFHLAARQPAELRTLPLFPGDQLDPAKSNGDLCIQACAEDPQVAVHAIRNLARIGFGTVSVRWSQLGFGRTSSTSTSQATPRNLFGFKDGTANIKDEETIAVQHDVWVPAGADAKAGWLVGGSYLIARRINMDIEVWDRQSLQEQETVIGRSKAEGAPLSGGTEFSELNFTLAGSAGQPLIDKTAHVRAAHPDFNHGVRMLRRGYNFVDGSTGLGRLDAGLFFLAYVSDPSTRYIPVQNAVARDGMAEYLQPTGSALFAVPPGISQGQYVGQALFS